MTGFRQLSLLSHDLSLNCQSQHLKDPSPVNCIEWVMSHGPGMARSFLGDSFMQSIAEMASIACIPISGVSLKTFHYCTKLLSLRPIILNQKSAFSLKVSTIFISFHGSFFSGTVHPTEHRPQLGGQLNANGASWSVERRDFCGWHPLLASDDSQQKPV